ncbi:MAG: hypothetical protein M3P50_02445, partial [Actinomycetota bacterium]|nr:hypothetical protein [Actinomycetota bacterium]
MRWLALWLGLLVLYASTLGIGAFGTSGYGGDEPHYLLTAESIVADGDVDLADQYAERGYERFYPYVLDVHGRRTGGRVHEPHGVGFPLLIVPVYALGGAVAVEGLMAALAALAFVLAALLARRLVPEPWATGGVLLVALSPPALAYSATVYPELAAGALLAGAVLCALRVRESPRLRYAYGGAVMLAVLPWLGTKYVIPAIPVAIALVRWVGRRGRRVAALGVGEVMFASLVLYVAVNDLLYGGPTPYAADDPGQTATDAAFPAGYLERLPRLTALWVDREYGLLRWAPVLALAFFAVWLLWRSRRERLATLLPERLDLEIAAALVLAVCLGQVVVAAFGAPTMFGFWFPGRHLVAALPCAAALTAWGLRYAPRAGAVLGALTVAASAWLLVDLWTGAAGGWVDP